MKNIIFLNDRFGFELLENTEEETNSIWIYFPTTEDADQVLHVKKGFYEYGFELESGTAQEFELPSRLWAVDGDTEIQLTRAGGDTLPALYINFPEELTTNAMLDQGEDTRHYKMQGRRDEAAELRLTVIATQNGRDFEIPAGIRQKILELTWLKSRDTETGVVNATILLQITGLDEDEEGTIEATLRYNNVYDEVFIPRQRVKNGYQVLTISYPVLTMKENEVNIFQVYLRTSAGTALIPQQNAKASILASGLVRTNKFTGEIELTDIVTPFELGGQALELLGILETVNASTQNPHTETITAQVQLIPLGEGLTLADIEGELDQQIPINTLFWERQPGSEQGTAAEDYTWDAAAQSFIWEA